MASQQVITRPRLEARILVGCQREDARLQSCRVHTAVTGHKLAHLCQEEHLRSNAD